MASAGITLVTGANGFLGRHLVAHLVAQGALVRAAILPADNPRALATLGVEVVAADLTQPGTLPPLFDGHVERVFHLGAICNFSTPYAVLRRVNVDGVDCVTELARAAGVRIFVHMSSTSVYGPYRSAAFVEDAHRAPQDAYGRSKRDGEDVVREHMNAGLPAIILRPCTVYGPGCTDGAGKAFSRPTSIAAIPGSGRQRLANVRVEDVAAAAVHLATSAGAIGHAFNIADDSSPTLADALTLAARAFGRPVPRRKVPLVALRAIAAVQAVLARRRHAIPDLELDALRYLGADYAVDNSKLKATGFRLRYPDFAASMQDMGRRYGEERKRSSRGGTIRSDSAAGAASDS